MTPRIHQFAVAVFLAIAWPGAGHAAPPADTAFFETRIRPILEEHCFECHGEDKQKNKLRLDTAVGILRGGESGEPVLVRGLSAESDMIRRVTSQSPKEVMPPKGERLTAEQVKLLREWIDAGAAMPGADAVAASLQLKTDHWSFQAVKRPAVVTDEGAIDELIGAKLREKRLRFSPAADRATLIRRVYLVMHGMPPTPRETADFLNDTQPDAYARLVDRVLTSPRYGERWARHWMDVVRYADTNGFETNRERKTAFHYRDYLIEALNSDKPYDRFIREQIAGDALGVDAATGFLVAGPYDIVKSPDINLTLMQRQDELADMVNTTGTAFLGLTMGCARCHNHKFDPILQKDYYAMQAVFAGVRHGERPLREKVHAAAAEQELAGLRTEESAKNAELNALRKKSATNATPTVNAPGLRPAVNARLNEDSSFPPTEAVAVKFSILATNSAEPCMDEWEIYDADGKNVALATNGAKASASGTLKGYEIHKLAHINDGLTGNAHSWISDTNGEGWVRIDFPAKVVISRIVWSRDREGRFADRVPTKYKIEVATERGKWTPLASSDDRRPFSGKPEAGVAFAHLSGTDAAAARKLVADIADLQSRIAKEPPPEAWVGTFASKPDRTYRLYRGEPMQKREVVAPDALSVLGTLGLSVDAPEQQRRVRLAEWIASPHNPLTARVLVNRLWHYTFGNGLVDTPSDFGANGGRPTHPELLDWLADEFVKSGWSIKHIQRLILLSSAFQQSSAPRPDAAKVDADGRYLWRYTPRRLEAEAIRDSTLAVSGALDLHMGGPGFYLMDVVPENVMHYFPKEKYSPAEFRRMVYLFRIRAAQDGVFGAFDCPDGGSVMAKRSRSNTPLQALNLFNSSFILGQSEILAQRLRTEAGETPAAQAALAFQLFYARPPDAYEQRNSEAMIHDHGLLAFARALFNTSEFLFIF